MPKLNTMPEDLWPFEFTYLPAILVVSSFLLSSWVSIHAVLYKRDTRAVISWVGLAWLAPFLGSIAYFLLGINRVRRRATALGFSKDWEGRREFTLTESETDYRDEFVRLYPQLRGQAALVGELSGRQVVPGNQVIPLENGDEAFPEMLAAIGNAQQSISMLSYIFDSDRAGSAFCEALGEASRRGVEVRVLIDAMGARYSRENMVTKLQAAGVKAAAFLPTSITRLNGTVNLRNHRKILVVDGSTAFTGGTNIREDHWFKLQPKHPVACLHFCLIGPIAVHLQEVFAIDWAFTTGEVLQGSTWFPTLARCGNTWCRGIAHGPDEDFEKITYTLMGALGFATQRIRIVTPYFLPHGGLVYALQLAAMKGVQVEILLPTKSNFRLVQWASQPLYRHMLDKGCRLFLSPEPFDHTKLMIVDDVWSLVGSTNWDARSLRLNFEFNVECYDPELASQLNRLVDAKISRARQLSNLESSSLPIWKRVRNGLARVLSPYL